VGGAGFWAKGKIYGGVSGEGEDEGAGRKGVRYTKLNWREETPIPLVGFCQWLPDVVDRPTTTNHTYRNV